MSVCFWLHANGGPCNMIWKIKCIHKFPGNTSHLKTQIFCQLVDCLQIKREDVLCFKPKTAQTKSTWTNFIHLQNFARYPWIFKIYEHPPKTIFSTKKFHEILSEFPIHRLIQSINCIAELAAHIAGKVPPFGGFLLRDVLVKKMAGLSYPSNF